MIKVLTFIIGLCALIVLGAVIVTGQLILPGWGPKSTLMAYIVLVLVYLFWIDWEVRNDDDES
jgi:hypothetical protein